MCSRASMRELDLKAPLVHRTDRDFAVAWTKELRQGPRLLFDARSSTRAVGRAVAAADVFRSPEVGRCEVSRSARQPDRAAESRRQTSGRRCIDRRTADRPSAPAARSSDRRRPWPASESRLRRRPARNARRHELERRDVARRAPAARACAAPRRARSGLPDSASVRASALCMRSDCGARSTARRNAAADSSKSLRCSWIRPSVRYAGRSAD